MYGAATMASLSSPFKYERKHSCQYGSIDERQHPSPPHSDSSLPCGEEQLEHTLIPELSADINSGTSLLTIVVPLLILVLGLVNLSHSSHAFTSPASTAQLELHLAAATPALTAILPTNEKRKSDIVTTATTTPAPSTQVQRKKDKEHFFLAQLIDHNLDIDAPSNHFSQRYYEKADYFAGPGHPIMVIVGGEDDLWGILYPFVSENLAQDLGAFTLCPEHRFYGKSWPITYPNNDDLKQLLSPSQAMKDLVRLVKHKQYELGCSPDKDSASYCPVVTVGGSYPGFLSAMLRLVHPDAVDIAYASSAPILLYSQSADPEWYYEKVTHVAENASPGCATAVKEALIQVHADMSIPRNTANHVGLVSELALSIGVCRDTIPEYIVANPHVFADELLMVVNSRFADMNMDYYPPSSDTDLVSACQLFQNPTLTHVDKVRQFFETLMEDEAQAGLEKEDNSCYDLMWQLPAGPNATISGSDWSGMGPGKVAWIWDFQCCTLMPPVGFSEQSMFPFRPWTLEWLTDHCTRRFDVTPVIGGLVHELFGPDFTSFENLLASSKASKILFTNGLNDGWSVASILQNKSDTVQVINMESGAHHSELTHGGPSPNDPADVQLAHIRIKHLLELWLAEI
jgi:pimeloyl-ACP methyl ester carboxylesterase